jgi:thiamine-phosphate pyrophosphorylase
VADLTGRHLYLCTPDRPNLVEFVTACVEGGVDVVQLRDKQLDAAPLLERARLLVERCRELGVPFILNDRPDLALHCGATGVHVGQDDAPAALARRLLGPDAIVGLSTHRQSDLEGALALGDTISYLSAGPVEATPTKPGRPGVGLEYVRLATSRSPLPVFITGGVTPEQVPALAAAGARHFVVVRYLCEAPDPSTAARSLRQRIDSVL